VPKTRLPHQNIRNFSADGVLVYRFFCIMKFIFIKNVNFDEVSNTWIVKKPVSADIYIMGHHAQK